MLFIFWFELLYFWKGYFCEGSLPFLLLGMIINGSDCIKELSLVKLSGRCIKLFLDLPFRLLCLFIDQKARLICYEIGNQLILIFLNHIVHRNTAHPSKLQINTINIFPCNPQIHLLPDMPHITSLLIKSKCLQSDNLSLFRY